MRLFIQCFVAAVLMVIVIVGLICFGFSDFVGFKNDEQFTILEARPWRPYARLAFSFIMISLTVFFGGAFFRSSIQRLS